MKPQERIIVALDVPTPGDGLEIVRELAGLISFYKIGLELMMSGRMDELLRRLLPENRVFLDLKLPNDIPETVRKAVGVAAKLGVEFLTLSNGVSSRTIREAVAGRGSHSGPGLLFVPFLSSLDRVDFAESTGRAPSELEAYLVETAANAKAAGADGFIVSGPEIGTLRARYPAATLVSPGIRPAGSPADDHKRSCTPAEAIRLGADYIVVGRPIRNAASRRAAAQSIVDEVAAAGR
jgi:orotidine-5'-phosphate decarboxylase